MGAVVVLVEVGEVEDLEVEGVVIEADLVVDEEVLEDVVEIEEEEVSVEEEEDLITDQDRISNTTSQWTLVIWLRLDELYTQVKVENSEPSLVAGLFFPNILCFLTI